MAGFEPKARDALGLPILVAQYYTLVCEMGAGPVPSRRMVGWATSDDLRDQVVKREQIKADESPVTDSS